MMLTRLFGSALLAVVALNGASFAQSQGTSGTSGTHAQQAQALPQEIKQRLEKHGFTDVQVVPGSYIVSAKAKDGDPVTAIIGPHSLTVFTMNAPSSSSTVGSGSKAKSNK